MKTIGMIGGTSWHSTIHYYRIINETVNRAVGGQNAARIVMSSINFQDIFGPPDWAKLERMFTAEARRVEAAGADFFILCSNGLHHLTEALRASVAIPMLSIIECVADAITERGFTRVGLIGTRGTMTDGYYQEALAAHGIETIAPDEADREIINDIIFSELTLGSFTGKSRATYVRIIKSLAERGAEGVILGCTEIPLLITQRDTEVPLFDTLTLHAAAAAQMAMS